MKKPEPLFYIERPGNVVAGPYDLIQMAGLLRRRIIDGQTPTRRDGEEAWMPFSWQPQFSVAREMSPDAVSTRVAEQEEANAPLVPLPSRETVLKLAGAAVVVLIIFAVSFALAWFDQVIGNALLIIGIAVVSVAQCFILIRLLDESVWTWLSLGFVPLYDIYFIICNFSVYGRWIALKYAGAAIALGALLGLACHRY